MEDKRYLIYALKEPNSDIVRYIGLTGRAFNIRYKRKH